MARIRIDLSPPVGLAVFGLALLLVFLWPSDFRRDPVLQLRGFFAQVPKYEALYRDCADPRQNWPRGDSIGILIGMAHNTGPRFYAEDDAAAVRFAQSARPGCRLAVLYRIKRFYFGRGNSPNRYERVY